MSLYMYLNACTVKCSAKAFCLLWGEESCKSAFSPL